MLQLCLLLFSVGTEKASRILMFRCLSLGIYVGLLFDHRASLCKSAFLIVRLVAAQHRRLFLARTVLGSARRQYLNSYLLEMRSDSLR
jgi:hypothetical protein